MGVVRVLEDGICAFWWVRMGVRIEFTGQAAMDRDSSGSGVVTATATAIYIAIQSVVRILVDCGERGNHVVME